ncbi:MAG: aminotransferase class IV [Candidatus Omnitrophota bacterium]
MTDKLYAWIDGRVSSQEVALFNLRLGAFHYGLAAFEGILAVRARGKGRNGVALFRAPEHIARLLESAQALHLDVRYSPQDILEAIREIVIRNGSRTCYVRPLLFGGNDYLHLARKNMPASLAVMVRPFNFLAFSLKMKIPVSLTTFGGRDNPSAGALGSLKVSGRYAMNMLAKRYALDRGCADAVLFDSSGSVAEATSSNIFIICKNKISTPAPGKIIDGITRKTVISILEQMGLKVAVRVIGREELLESDAIFLTGTASGIVCARNIEGHKLNAAAFVPAKLRSRYIDIISGRDDKNSSYLNYC